MRDAWIASEAPAIHFEALAIKRLPGDGAHPYETSAPLHNLQHLDDLDAAADFLFPHDSISTSAAPIQRAFLSPFNAHVDLFNRLMLERLLGRAGILILLMTVPCNFLLFI